MYETGLIYYISKSNIELIYKKNFGPIIEITIDNKVEQQNKFSLKLGLEKLLKIITGATFSAEGELVKIHTKGKGEVIKETVEDRALVIIKEIFTDYNVTDINDITKHESPYPVYRFCLPLKTSESFNQKGTGTLIEVSYYSDYLRFKGVTSSENWTSNSLLNNILYTDSFKAAGIFVPLEVTKENNLVNLTVQYLIICSSSILGEYNVGRK